jgi:hypothetical protein
MKWQVGSRPPHKVALNTPERGTSIDTVAETPNRILPCPNCGSINRTGPNCPQVQVRCPIELDARLDNHLP